MSVLIDTNVVSEVRKGERCHNRVRAWYGEVSDQEIFLSDLTIGEIRRRINSIARRGAKSAAVLERWLRGLVQHFAERILPVAIAEEWVA